jgi:indole-3-glycerol phosphate synthase
MILDEIAQKTFERVRQSKQSVSEDILKEQAYAMPKGNKKFQTALKSQNLSFICEIKKASPSKGLIAESFDPVQIAKEYEIAGADAISVLTEPFYFQGSNDYLKDVKENVTLPVLRKDFVVDAYQIYEAKTIGADAVLLICALLETKILSRYLTICTELGLSALVEAHTKEEILSALSAGASVIGVNNRDLKTFDVDLERCIRLRALVPSDKIYIAESGIKTAEDIKRLRDANVDAVLIGETLMRSADKTKTLNGFKGDVRL